ncbi:MAG: biotin/lipoyl-binding protein [Bacteroidota bacterium]|nr:biotin/lipoyl-binding protein [Bacteroidota bacterium]
MPDSHPHDLPPYLVTIRDGDGISVDPEQLREDGTRLVHIRGNRYLLHRNGRTVPVIIQARGRQHVELTHGSHTTEAVVRDHRDQLLAAWGADEGVAGHESRIDAPMPGLVLKVLVEPGSPVQKGDPLLVLEAMKMENDIKAHFDGTVSTLHVQMGDAVSKGQLLIEFE